MKKTQKAPKLSLNKSTLRKLQGRQLSSAVGGVTSLCAPTTECDPTWDCPTLTTCGAMNHNRKLRRR